MQSNGSGWPARRWECVQAMKWASAAGEIMVWLATGICVAAFAGVYFAPRLSRQLFVQPRVDADLPCAFGYKMAWLAVKTRDTARLIETLKLEDAHSANWSVGIGTVYNERIGLRRVFVTPPIDGWSFVVGLSLPHPMGDAYEDKCMPLINELSREFGSAQYFVSYPKLEFFGWASLYSGQLRRAFACGEEGVIWNKGSVTPDERAIGIELFSIREAFNAARGRNDFRPPQLSEAHVLEIARRWSLDPTRLELRGDLEKGIGYVATAPAEWQASAPARYAA